MTNFAQTFNK